MKITNRRSDDGGTIYKNSVSNTKSATITWNLKARKDKYSLTPFLVKNSSIRLLSIKKLSFRI
ncbi:MAG: hypothetical protein FWH29_01070 [Methanobrevibacter sp.]|nr:hypothetical protein [Methanobrevibacter sp.]